MPKIRVLIVDDAVVMRRLISEALARDPEIEVVGAAAHGRIALAKIPQVNPDIITLDVEMPEMDGLATVREIRRLYPRLPVLMFSSHTEHGAAQTLEALAAGASDYVTKPSATGSIGVSIDRLEHDLLPKIKLHCRHLVACGQALASGPSRPPLLVPPPPLMRMDAVAGPVDLVAIGCSTGGPNALADIFSQLPARLPVPVVIVQHMPVLFTRLFAERLDKLGPVRFHEGSEGRLLEPGHAYIAPGGHHMTVAANAHGLVLRLNDDPPENSCRPAVDVLFRSVAAVCGGRVLAAILTGMGRDGYHGCQCLRERGAQIIAQDEKSSVVWGMPGYVAEAGLADRILPLDQISAEVSRRAHAHRARAVPTAAA